MSAAVTGERRFPSPWKVEELEACFFVTDSAGQKLASVYFEEEPGRRRAAKLLTKKEARRHSNYKNAGKALAAPSFCERQVIPLRVVLSLKLSVGATCDGYVRIARKARPARAGTLRRLLAKHPPPMLLALFRGASLSSDRSHVAVGATWAVRRHGIKVE
jgi:hypothetical protein